MQDIKPLLVFAAVLEHGSMNGAAQALGMTPSAVSQHITRLESLHGIKLLNRSTRHLTPTEAGHTLGQHCRRLRQSWLDAHAALDGVKGLRILPFREGECRSNHWFFSLYLKDSGLDRDTVIEKLQAQHIQTRPVWALIHEQADYPRNEAYGLDKALDYRKYIVNLPCSTNLSFEDCDRVIEAVLGL